MPILPLRPRLKSYRGSKENLHRKNTDYNAMASRVAEHLNTLIANNPDEIQQYFFGMIALDLGLTVEQVWSAISDGGHNGITIRVTEQDRQGMARYKTAS
jgi:hypothetical protein